MKKAYFLFFITIFTSNLLQSQDVYTPATWETVHGKSEKGFVLNRIKGGQYLSVKYSEKDKPIQKSADEIVKVLENDFPIIYSYKLRSGGKTHSIFLELLQKGRDTHLYKGKDETLGKLYAVFKNDQFTIINKGTDLNASYSFLYGDCNENLGAKKHVFTEKDILKAFKEYQSCKGYSISSNDMPQRKWKPYYYVGPKIGLNSGKFAMRDDSYLDRGNYSDFMSMRVGIVGKLGITDRISTQLELSYYNKGTSSDSVNTWPAFYPEVYSTVNFSFDVLDVQLLLHYSIISKPKFKTDLGFGFVYGHFLNTEFEQLEIDPIDEGSGPVTMDFGESRDIGYLVNIEMVYSPNQKNQFAFDARYIGSNMHTFMSLVVGNIPQYYGRYQLNSSMMELSFSYFFKLK